MYAGAQRSNVTLPPEFKQKIKEKAQTAAGGATEAQVIRRLLAIGFEYEDGGSLFRIPDDVSELIRSIAQEEERTEEQVLIRLIRKALELLRAGEAQH
jgi:hypothetical protein